MRDTLAATYANIVTVRSRKVYQIVFEGPLEEMALAMQLFGPPMPDAEVWAGIARLNLDANGRPVTKPAPVEQIEDHRPPAKLAQIAGITCNERGFWIFLGEKGDHQPENADQAANYVRLICGVKSRAELDTNPQAAARWRDLKANYDLWLKDVAA